MVPIPNRSRLPHATTIDEGSVGTAEVANEQVLAHAENLGVPSRDTNRTNLQIDAGPPSDHEGIVVDGNRRQRSRRGQAARQAPAVSTRLEFPVHGQADGRKCHSETLRAWVECEANEPYVKFLFS